MNVVSRGSVGYVCVRYATNVVHCIVKNINIVPVVLVVYYYGWIGVLLSLSLECGQSWVGGL